MVALKTRHAGQEGRVDGDLFVVCNGRNSALRKSCGLETETFETTADALWLRFDLSESPELLPARVDVHMFGKGLVVVLQPSSGHRLHIAYSAPEDLNALRKDVPELQARACCRAERRARPVARRASSTRHTESQVLKIIVDRVKSWHAPGILFLGDAAHTMSPSGGQGLNVAIRDTFVAANHLVPHAPERGTRSTPLSSRRSRTERQPEIDALQAGQTRAGQMVLKPLPVLHLMFTMLGRRWCSWGRSSGPGTALRHRCRGTFPPRAAGQLLTRLEVLVEELDRPLPRQLGGGLVVARRGVVVEAVLRAGIDVKRS